MSTVRPARLSDAAEIARLAGQLGYPVEAGTMATRLDRLSQDPLQRVYVVDGESGLAGWIAAERRMSLEVGERVEITGLVVDSTVRRAGVGRALVRAVESWAAEQDSPSLVVRSNVQRQAAHRFYENLGYVRQKSQHVYARKPVP